MVERRDLLKWGAAGAALTVLQGSEWAWAHPGATTRPSAFEIGELGVDALQEGMASGRWSAESLVMAFRRRIAEIDHAGPELRTVIEVNPDAAAIARELDAERRDNGPRGPLHGIPVLLKDNLDTGDRMQTTAGSLALLESRPAGDSHVARRLREAGAVILGKANLSEWANFRSPNSSSGWSARGGQARNPYALDRSPCGSSSGSGASVAAGLAPLAVGTETDGSIVCPSSANSLVGIKPTVGLVSRQGIIPISHSQDTAGPMARTVRDAALLLGAMAGVDPKDPATKDAGKGHADYTPYLRADGLKGARLGVLRSALGFHAKVDQRIEEALAAMRQAGAEIVDLDYQLPRELGRAEFQVLLYEFKAGLNAYLATRRGGGPRTLAEVIRFNEKNQDREMPYFGQETFLQAQEKGPLSEETYREARATCLRLSREEGIDALVIKHRLDAIVGPSGGPPWTVDWVNGDHFGGGSSRLAAVSGYPHITVPAGYIHGLPVGLSFFGPAYTEPKLLTLAYAYEQATQLRRPPRFLGHADWGS